MSEIVNNGIKKVVLELKKLYVSDPKKFKKGFVLEVYRVLVVYKKEPCVERLCSFIVDFATFKADSENEEERELMESFAFYLLLKLVEHVDANDKAVRYRTTLLISEILSLTFLLTSN